MAPSEAVGNGVLTFQNAQLALLTRVVLHFRLLSTCNRTIELFSRNCSLFTFLMLKSTPRNSDSSHLQLAAKIVRPPLLFETTRVLSRSNFDLS